MRTFLVTMIAASTAFIPNAWAFQMGDALTLDALGKAEVIQGEIPKTWEPGKVYVVQCWATWNDPCVAGILQLDTMQDRYKSKGLRVIGVNIWEDGKDKVAEFVKSKGSEMSFPVIYTGKEGSAFEASWLKPAGVKAIPYSFVVKDGKYLFGTHPARLDDETIQGLLAGGSKQDAAVKIFTEREAKLQKVDDLLKEIAQASEAKDLAAMDAKLLDLENVDPANPYLRGLRIGLLIERKDWSAFDKLILDGSAEKAIQPAINLDEVAEVPESSRKALLAKLLTLPAGDKKYMVINVLVSRYQWMTGDKEAAKACAKKIAEKPGTLPPGPMAIFAASVDGNAPQTFKEVFAAISAAREAEDALAAEAKPQPEKPEAKAPTTKSKKKRR